MRFHLQQVGVEDDFGTPVVNVVVLGCDVVHADVAEYRHYHEIAFDDRVRSHFSVSSLDTPFLEDLTRHEEVMRHGADSFARRTEVLLEPFFLRLAVFDDERHGIHVRKGCCDIEVGRYGFTTDVLRFPDKPTSKLLAFNGGIGGKRKLVAVVVRIGFIVSAVHCEGNGEHVLLVFRPNLCVFANGY